MIRRILRSWFGPAPLKLRPMSQRDLEVMRRNHDMAEQRRQAQQPRRVTS